MKYNVDVKSPKKRQLSLNTSNARKCIQQVANTISYRVPNYYWESINYTYYSFLISFEGFAKELRGYGFHGPDYFLSSDQYYSSFSEVDKSSFISNVITYVDSDDDIEATPLINDSLLLTNCEYKVNISNYIRFAASEVSNEVVRNYFLDMISAYSRMISDLNPYKNAVVLRMVIDNNYTPAWDAYIPLCFRIESEGLAQASKCVNLTPKIIDVNYTPINPIIMAYDGPDPNRNAKQVLWFDPNKGRSYNPYQDNIIEEHYIMSAVHTSPPIYLNTNADFKGILYAPFSRVYINGPGKINGCVVAGDIVDNSNINRTIYNTDITVPRLASEFQNDAQSRYNYITSITNANIKIVTDEFNMFGLHNLYKDNLYCIGHDPSSTDSI